VAHYLEFPRNHIDLNRVFGCYSYLRYWDHRRKVNCSLDAIFHSVRTVIIMGPYIKECEVKASPATIWEACFAPMTWETWDPDVAHIENVSGGLVTGTSFEFIMKEGPVKNIPVVLTDVKEHEVIKYVGSVLKGAMKFDSLVEIFQLDAHTSRVRYSFDMFGVLGSTVNYLNPKAVTNGVDGGLANIKRLSEEAAAS
jgi:Polyketide cyclase / dehydrase and lipid transport